MRFRHLSISDLTKCSGLAGTSFFKSADKYPHQVKERISTGSGLNDLLGGGLELGVVTQFYGEPITGKTHLCHLLCVASPSQNQVIYIDSERSFRTEKIESIAEAKKLNCTDILHRLHLVQPQDSESQESEIEKACSLIQFNPKIKLLIIDSLMTHYRSEYGGRSKLAERSHRLNKYLSKLSTIAYKNNIAVILTNQSASYQDSNFQLNNPKPFGGNIVSYSSSYIIRLERRKLSDIAAILVKSPLQGYRTCDLTIFEGGFLSYTTKSLKH
jgi:DNA repair protein RadA